MLLRIISALVIAVLGFALVFCVWHNKQAPVPVQQEQEQASAPPVAHLPTTPYEVNVTDWMTYSSPVEGFVIQHPAYYSLGNDPQHLLVMKGSGSSVTRTSIEFSLIKGNFQAIVSAAFSDPRGIGAVAGPASLRSTGTGTVGLQIQRNLASAEYSATYYFARPDDILPASGKAPKDYDIFKVDVYSSMEDVMRDQSLNKTGLMTEAEQVMSTFAFTKKLERPKDSKPVPKR